MGLHRPGEPGKHALEPGDLVEYDGEEWDVDEVIPATACKPARLVLGKSEGGEFENGGRYAQATVVDADPARVRLITRRDERTLIPGTDWYEKFLVERDLEAGAVSAPTRVAGRQAVRGP